MPQTCDEINHKIVLSSERKKDIPMNHRTRLVLLILITLLVTAAATACGRGNQAEEPETAPAAAAEPMAEEATAEEPTAEPMEAAEPTEEPAEEADVEEAPAEADSEDTASEADAAAESPISVAFLQPTDNAIIPVTSTVIMTVTGVTIAPAGQVVEGEVHLHILVNVPFIEVGQVIPANEQHLHFGDGSTTVEVGLPVGTHTLRLQAADGAHIALEGDEYRDEIVVTVSEDAAEQAVRFAKPTDGATVPPTFDVVMAATGLIVEPSGPINANAGHMHILVNTDFIEPGLPIPNDETHLHFGSGQLNTTVELEPGDYVLRLQMADGAHVALEGEQYRNEITVTVAEDAPTAQVYIVEPTDGATVPPTFDVKMAAAGLFVEKSGPVLRETGGHMHLLVDTDFIEAGQVIPADDQHIHFGGGQLTATLELEPGEHVIRLQMANGAHLAMEGEQYRYEITVTVDE